MNHIELLGNLDMEPLIDTDIDRRADADAEADLFDALTVRAEAVRGVATLDAMAADLCFELTQAASRYSGDVDGRARYPWAVGIGGPIVEFVAKAVGIAAEAERARLLTIARGDPAAVADAVQRRRASGVK